MKNKLLLFFSAIMSLNLICSNASNFTYYRNLGIKAITYPLRQFWNSSRSTKALVAIGAIGAIGALALWKKQKALKDRLKKELDRIEKNINTIKNEIDNLISKNSDDQGRQISTLSTDLANVINLKNKLDSDQEIFNSRLLSVDDKIKLTTQLLQLQIKIKDELLKLNELKKIMKRKVKFEKKF